MVSYEFAMQIKACMKTDWFDLPCTEDRLLSQRFYGEVRILLDGFIFRSSGTHDEMTS